MPHLRRVPLALCLSVTFASGCAAAGRGATPAPSAEVPPEIALPAGEQRVLRLDARGTQDYACRPNPDAPGEFKWVLTAPEAELLDGSGTSVGRHYAGPTWESSADGSKVVATVKARVAAPQADAVPWLLLTATETSSEGLLANVKSVQRTDTRGGQAPSAGCADGDTLKVPYSAVYWFSR